MWYLIPIYIVALACILFLSVALASILNQLDRRTKISSVFLGGVVLAGVTSLPELFTTISSACLLSEPSLAFGGILGSNIMNIFIFAIFIIVAGKLFVESEINKRNLTTTICCLVVSIIVLIYSYLSVSFVIPTINVNGISFAIIIIYALMLYFNRGDKKESFENDKSIAYRFSPATLGWLFALCAVLLIAFSIGLTYLTNVIADVYTINKNLAGALFIAIATALPEVVTTAMFIKMKNFNLATSSIMGGVAFNWLILAIADIFYFHGSVFMQGESAQLLAIFSVISVALLTAMLALRIFLKNQNKVKWAYYTISSLLCALTLTYLVLAFVII